MQIGVGAESLKNFNATGEPTGETVVYDVEKIINDGRVEDIVTPLPGYKVTMHTLTVGESEKVKKENNGKDLILNPDPNSKDIDLSYWLSVLTYGITELNGKSYKTPEQKRELRAILDGCQYKVVFSLISAWAILFQKQNDLLGDSETKKAS